MYAFNVAEFNAGLYYATPEIFLSLAACALLMLDLFLSDSGRRWNGALAVLAVLVTAVLAAVQPVSARVVALGGLYELDRMAQVLKVVTLLSVAVVFVYSTDYLRRRAILKGEYYVLGLFATVGATLPFDRLVASVDELKDRIRRSHNGFRADRGAVIAHYNAARAERHRIYISFIKRRKAYLGSAANSDTFGS